MTKRVVEIDRNINIILRERKGKVKKREREDKNR